MKQRLAASLFGRFLPWKRNPPSKPQAPATQEMPLDSALDPDRVGQCDAWLAGWYTDAGELYPGFSIGAADVVLEAGRRNPGIDAFCEATRAQIVRSLDGGPETEPRDRVAFATRILSLDTPGECADPQAHLAALVAAGKPGARFLLGFPAAWFVTAQQDIATGTGFRRGFEPHEARALIEAAGLSVVHEAGDGFFSAILDLFEGKPPPAEGERPAQAKAWAGCWADALAGRDGAKIQSTMNDILPSRLLYVAVKPGGRQIEPVRLPPPRFWPQDWAVEKDPDVDTVSAVMISLEAEAMTGALVKETRELFAGYPIPADEVVLDVGCGAGGMAAFCRELGAKLILADVDAANLENARDFVEARSTGHSITLLPITDASSIPLEDGKIARIVCTEVLEHVPDPDAALAELVRLGSPGALYALSVPGDRSEATQKTLAPPSYFQHPNHIRIIDAAAFRAMVERAGLTIERYQTDGFYAAMAMVFFWQTNVDLGEKHHSLDLWARTLNLAVHSTHGKALLLAVNAALPKRQIIVARKAAA